MDVEEGESLFVLVTLLVRLGTSGRETRVPSVTLRLGQSGSERRGTGTVPGTGRLLQSDTSRPPAGTHSSDMSTLERYWVTPAGRLFRGP